MPFVYHTDGDVRPLLDCFDEAGFDCIQPMEAKAKMDVRELRTKLAAGMECRAYAYHSDHSVPPQVSWATDPFIIELLDKHGNYECVPRVGPDGVDTLTYRW